MEDLDFDFFEGDDALDYRTPEVPTSDGPCRDAFTLKRCVKGFGLTLRCALDLIWLGICEGPLISVAQ